MTEADFIARLDRLAEQGETVRFWLRDDDAVEPTHALDELLDLCSANAVPLALAVIPEHTGRPLADHLAGRNGVDVTVHGWSHVSYAGPGEKKQELGTHRPAEVVLGELRCGREKLAGLYGAQLLPMLVPPWNRIAPEVVAGLPQIGFRVLSVFGREKPAALPLINTHVDIMDWHGSRGGRPAEALFAETAELLASPDRPPVIGMLTHHLVHDQAAWAFLDRLFAATAGHPACQWIGAGDGLAGQ